MNLGSNNLIVSNVDNNQFALKYKNSNLILGIRSQDLVIVPEDQKDISTNTCLLVDYEYLGNRIYLYCKIKEDKLTFVTSPYVNAKLNEKIYFKINFEKAHFFDAETGNRII